MSNTGVKKVAVSIADSTELRVILGVLYIMTEVLRRSENEAIRNNFKFDLRMKEKSYPLKSVE
jgi:hypothetical protein